MTSVNVVPVSELTSKNLLGALLGNYTPTQNALDINRARIYERLQEMETQQ
jgi:hypothetical protein